MELSGRSILVTGGSSGIGRAVAVAYANEGATVWVVARRRGPLEQTLAMGPPGMIRPVVADLTDLAGRATVANTLASQTGALDVAVHAAGLLGPPGVPLETYPANAWYEVFEANVSAVHFLHQELAGLLHRSKRPTVIGVSSTVGKKGRAGWGMYAVSKFALEGWLETLADEWAHTGRVYAVNPGGTRTPMRAEAMPGEDPDSLPAPADIVPIFLRLAHAECAEPSGSRFEAREWIGRDPWR